MVNYGALPVYYKGGNIEMSVQVEKLEKSMAKLTIEVPAKELDLALDKAYKKNRNKIAPGSIVTPEPITELCTSP